ncbi:MAG: hypothetical protein OEW19_03440 [Acidobacteriota bacterium]|nr:hypothetical protein [Acidobacteriota bacterium]
MIEQYFSAPKTLRCVRGGLSGTYIEGFIEALVRDGYTRTTILRPCGPRRISACSSPDGASP